LQATRKANQEGEDLQRRRDRPNYSSAEGELPRVGGRNEEKNYSTWNALVRDSVGKKRGGRDRARRQSKRLTPLSLKKAKRGLPPQRRDDWAKKRLVQKKDQRKTGGGEGKKWDKQASR